MEQPGVQARITPPAGRAARSCGYDLAFQLLPRRRVAEKAGHADQKLLEQELRFLGVLPQIPDVGRDPVNLVEAHAPLDPAVNGAFLVQGKVMAGLCPQQDEDLLQGALGLVLQGPVSPVDEGRVLEIGDDPAGQLLHRGDDVGQPRVNGALGHAVELGRGRRLDEDHPGLFLHGPQTQRAVGAHAREDDADAFVLQVVRQGTKEEINGQAEPPWRRRIKQVQDPVQDGQVPVGRDHIDAIRLDLHPVPDLGHRHGGGALEQLHHDALVRRVQVLDDDKGHAALHRHVSQKQLQRLQAAGGSADAHDGERAISAGRVIRLRRWGDRFAYLSAGLDCRFCSAVVWVSLAYSWLNSSL